MKHLFVVLFLLAGMGPAAAEKVALPGEGGLELMGWLEKPTGAGPHPAVLLLHGCSGGWAASGEPTALYRQWLERLAAEGYVALLLDSFGPRGQREICTQSRREVSVSVDRPADARAGLRWLAARAEVDRERLFLMGWSNGAMALLHTVKAGKFGADTPPIRAAVAFYPGCASFRDPYSPVAALLILTGGADDWTPARHCERLVEANPGRGLEIEVYEGAHHAFDTPAGEVRWRADVRNLSAPGGTGATVGPNPEARERAIARALAFLAAHSHVPRGTKTGPEPPIPVE